MKNYKLVQVTIYGETRPLYEWAVMYQIPFYIINKRFIDRYQGDDLLLPVRDRLINYNDVYELWHGKWKLKKESRIWNKYRKDAKWVYVGKKHVE